MTTAINVAIGLAMSRYNYREEDLVSDSHEFRSVTEKSVL